MKRNKKLSLIIGIPAAAFLLFCLAVLLFYHPDPEGNTLQNGVGQSPELSSPVSEAPTSPPEISPSASEATSMEAVSPSHDDSGDDSPDETEDDPEAPPVYAPPAEGDIVHVTASGKKYHREGCSALSKSDVKISLGNALRKGYSPCSICEPGYLPITPAPSPTSPPSQKPSSSPSAKLSPSILPAPESSPPAAPSDTAPSESPSEPPSPSLEVTVPTNDGDVIVYITASGKKYHTVTCRYTRNGAAEITLTQAKEDGYEPCSVCKPPG